MPIPKDYFLKFSLRGLAEPLTYQVDVESIKRLHQLFLSDPIEDSTPSFVEFEDVRGRMINVNMRHVTHARAFWDYHEANSEEAQGKPDPLIIYVDGRPEPFTFLDADEEELQSAALGFDDPHAQGAFISFLDDNDETSDGGIFRSAASC